jgi:hypothetical protein
MTDIVDRIATARDMIELERAAADVIGEINRLRAVEKHHDILQAMVNEKDAEIERLFSEIVENNGIIAVWCKRCTEVEIENKHLRSRRCINLDVANQVEQQQAIIMLQQKEIERLQKANKHLEETFLAQSELIASKSLEIERLECSLKSWQESYSDLLNAKMNLIDENTRLRDTLYKKIYSKEEGETFR